jgi:NAD(P)H-hydrate epimerase
MAKGGAGDVLSGILTALLGKMESIESALKLGVILHGIAGELAEEKTHSESLRPTDMIALLGEAYKNIEKSLKTSDTNN